LGHGVCTGRNCYILQEREKKEKFLVKLMGMWSSADVGARGELRSLQVNP